MADMQELKERDMKLEDVQSPPIYRSTKDRISIVLYVVHEQAGEPPFIAESRGSVLLQHSEASLKRTLNIKVGQSVTLDFSWLKDKMGTIILKNVTGARLTANPTEEEKEKIAKSVAYLKIKDVLFPLRPKRPMMFSPVPESGYVQDIPVLLAGEYDVSVTMWVIPG